MWHGPICPNRAPAKFTQPDYRENGIALIIAVVALFLLTVAVLHTRAGVNLAQEIASGSSQEMQALYMARSGLAIVHDALAEDDGNIDSYQDDWAAANDLGAVPIAEVGWAVGKVSDEEGKFNILDLVNEDGESDEDTDFAAQRLYELLVYIQVPDSRAEEIVDSLIDWMDFDDATTGSGAEDLYYSSLDTPYTCPNDVPSGMDDLTLVRGIGPDILYRGEGEIPPLIDYITVYGDKKPGDRFRRININTAPLHIILSLSPEMDEQLAEEIIASREGEPFGSAAEIKDVPGFPDEMYNNEIENGIKLADLIDVSSEHFSARITGETTLASSKVFGVFERKGNSVNLVYYRGF
ncbi:MAG: type II secretion system minor pseudopilin GspK [Pseudomonadota bacterium]|jgi:general secretion pathway protein K